jgi:hypothetical protein
MSGILTGMQIEVVCLTDVPFLLYIHILDRAEDQNVKWNSFCNEFPDISSGITVNRSTGTVSRVTITICFMNVEVKRLISMRRIREVCHSYLGLETNYPDVIHSYLRRLQKNAMNTSNYATAASFKVLSDLLFTNHPVGPLSPRHGASSGCGWRRRPPVMEESCEYIE